MSLLSKIFGKKVSPTLENQDLPKEKVFTFKTWEAECIGDWYKYEVKAETKDEAFKKLVNYFFGDSKSEDIKSSSGTVNYPLLSRRGQEGMPSWFARRISGQVRDEHTDYQRLLEDYARKNNIILQM